MFCTRGRISWWAERHLSSAEVCSMPNFVHHCTILQKALVQGYINPGHHVIPATKLCVVMPNICGSSVCNLLHLHFLVPKCLRWLQYFWKICGPLLQDHNIIVWVHPYFVFEINVRFLWKLILFSYCSK